METRKEMPTHITSASVGNTITKDSWLLRKEIVQTLHSTGGGHYGGAMSVLDILLTLYTKVCCSDDGSDLSKRKDKIILSKGHAAVALYCLLAYLGVIERSRLCGYGKFQSGVEGHPDMLVTPGIDFSSGSLGQGLSVGLGMALGLKGKAHVWVILGDGECQEGQIWEAALLAERYGVDNLHAIIDANGAQEFGYKYKPDMKQDPIPLLEDKWRAFDWQVEIADGHDHLSLEQSLQKIKGIKNKPSVLIARTKKGYGVPLFESDPEKFHCINLSEREYLSVIEGLDAKCNN